MPKGRKSSGWKGLTGQMVSFGVPSRRTIRSTCCISELPGSRGLWASNSAKMQPTALQGRRGVSVETLTQQPLWAHSASLFRLLQCSPAEKCSAHLPLSRSPPSAQRGWGSFFLTTYRWPWSVWLCLGGAQEPGTCKGKERVRALRTGEFSEPPNAQPACIGRGPVVLRGKGSNQLTTVSPLLESLDSGEPCKHEPAQSPLQEKTAQRGQGTCCFMPPATELSMWHLRCCCQRLTCLHTTFVSHE